MNNDGDARTHKKTYVLFFLCLHFKRQKNTRTKEESITTGMHAHKKNLCPFVLMSTLQKTEEHKNKRRINNDGDARAQKKLMSFCSYV